MPTIQKKSEWSPTPGRRIRRLLVDASRRAEAMGLIEMPSGADAGPQGDLSAFRHLATQAEKAGIATATAAALHNVETPTPEELASLLTTMIAARLHFLALLVGDLAGSYNDIGVRRWFQRQRTRLDGRAPADLLTGEWDPDDPGARRVREVARELVALSAT